MLGVIGIHIGSLALAPNDFTLYLWLEILSRYSVPAFFFISGYGLFANDRGLLTGAKLDYKAFLKKRLQGAGLPYLSWSLFYLLYFWLILPPGYVSWNPLHLAYVLFFGLGCYHLYFMVILLWFYAGYPLWRRLLYLLQGYAPIASMLLLFILQLMFNWWTTHPGIDTSGWNVVLKNFFDYRLNYLPLHYLFVFMAGGIAALNWSSLQQWLRQHLWLVLVFYGFSLIYDVGSCLYSVRYQGYDLLALANTYHQLSPQGLIYTIASLLFFCAALDKLEFLAHAHIDDKKNKIAKHLLKAISLLSANSMLIYFVHPLLLDWLTSFYSKFGIVMTVKKVSLSYVLLVLGSLALSLLLTKLFKRVPTLSLLFTGKK